jgi:hypothetical protein
MARFLTTIQCQKKGVVSKPSLIVARNKPSFKLEVLEVYNSNEVLQAKITPLT